MTAPFFVTIRIGEDALGIAAAEDALEGTGGQRFEMWIYAEDCAERVTKPIRNREATAPIRT